MTSSVACQWFECHGRGALLVTADRARWATSQLMRTIAFIFAIVLVASSLVGCSTRRPGVPSHSGRPITISPDDRALLQDGAQFREIRKKAKLSSAVVALCTDRNGRLADPGQRWNGTDVIYPDLASNRLIWAATNGDYYVLHYESGGFVSSAHILIATFKDGGPSPKTVWRATGPWLKNYDDFLDALNTHRLEDEREQAW